MSATAIILVNWNGATDTIECLESLLRLEAGDFRIIVVDNGSTDGSVERIADWAAGPARRYAAPVWERLPKTRARAPSFVRLTASSDMAAPTADITLIEAGANLGFAAANNLGMSFASADPDTRHYWLLNNDTVVAPDALTHLCDRMAADAGIGMLGARLMFYGEPDIVQGIAGGFSLARARGFHHGLGLSLAKLPKPDEIERTMAYVPGAAMFVRRELVDRIGGMHEGYFLYFEEIDWARRLPPGQRLAVATDAVIWHKEGGTIGSATRGRASDTSLYYLHAGLLRFYVRHYPVLLPLAIARLLREAAGHLRRKDGAAARVILRALRDVPLGIRRRGTYASEEFGAAGRPPFRNGQA